MFAGLDGEPDPASRGVVVPNALNPVQLKVGTDGDLFYVNLNDGEIRRVRFDGVDKPPTAVIAADVTSGPLPLMVNFDGTLSSDLNPGDSLTYAWDLDDDGQLDDSTDPQPSFAYTNAGLYTVTLEVTDSTGLKDTDTILISAGNTAPTAVIDQPSTSLTWIVDDLITFSGHADDPDEPGGTLPASQLDWDIVLYHCPGGCHTHFITSFAGTFTESFNAPDHEYPSYLEVKLTATDPVTGLQGTDSVLLFPETVDVTLASSPPGLNLTINGTTDEAPFTTSVIVGSNNSISANSPQTVGQTTYQFNSWSDGGSQNRNIIAGSQNETFTAEYIVIPSDTTDSGTGTITAQGENGSSESKEKAFDNNINTKWLDFANANPETRASWIQYQYANGDKFVVTAYTISSANDRPARDPRDWTLLGSNDGVNFTPLDTRNNEFFSSRFETREFTISNSTGYNVYRLDIHSVADPGGANSVQLSEIEFMATAPITASSGPKVTNVLVGNPNWSPDYKTRIPGADPDGYLIPHGADQTRTLHWSNIREVIVEFDQPIQGSGADDQLVPEDFLLSGINSGSVTILPPVEYDGASNRAKLTLATNLQRDRYVLKLDATKVTDLAGNALDGEFTKHQPGPSGDGEAGGSFFFDFNVMPGDFNRNGDGVVLPTPAVDSSDLSILAHPGCKRILTHHISGMRMQTAICVTTHRI